MESNKNIRCQFCDKLYSKYGIGIHTWRNHTSDGQKHNPNVGYKNGRVVWNKGLTKETDTRVKQKAENAKHKSYKGRKHTDVTKALLKEKALLNNYQRKSKRTLIYVKKDGLEVRLDSSWEYDIAKILDKNNINWERPSSLSWIDSNGIKHNYFPDFYLIDYDLFLDPKNDFVIQEQKEKLEYIKQHYFNVKILRKNEINEDFLISLLHTWTLSSVW